MSKLLKFADNDDGNSPEGPSNQPDNPWHVLVVDDDVTVHDVTRLILSSLEFDGRAIALTHAYSASEAQEVLSQPNEFAVLLLDVVMETEHAGLDLVHYIRDALNNQFIRIVLRTGQPGQAPELSVIADYDINDYRTKTELTFEKLRSCVTAALRSYRDIFTIHELANTREKLQQQLASRNMELEKLNEELQLEIEERQTVEQILASTNDKLESIINNSASIISLKDTGGRYDLVNHSFKQTLKLMDEDVLGKTDYEVFDEDTAIAIVAHDHEVLDSGEPIQREEILPTADGDHFYLSVKFPLYDENHVIYRICSISTDITDRLEAQNNIVHMAQFDALTDLPNRSLFMDRLAQAISRTKWQKNFICVMFIDLDRFKVINDTLGHDVGDKLLVDVAHRLQSLIRDGDSVCRLGGDEFAVILTAMTHESDVGRMAKKLMQGLCKPYTISNRELSITPSIGISRCPQDGDDVQVLLKKADVAMYKAKKAGKNAFRFYLKEDDSKASELLSLEIDMRSLLDKLGDQLFLLYQPKVNLNTGEYTSVEALLRWQHPKRGLIEPVDFIPLLEETGMIIDVGKWVLQQACRFAHRIAAAGKPTKVAVNLSSRQLKQDSLVKDIEDILEQTRCKAEWLELEVTESSLIDDIENTRELLKQISAMGIYLAIDDFGTGYSSMNYLKTLPFNSLKIDRSFIVDAPRIEQDRAIVTTIAQLASNLNMRVVAEGVETPEQFNLLKDIVKDIPDSEVQGYIFSKPVTEEKLLDITKEIAQMWDQINTDKD